MKRTNNHWREIEHVCTIDGEVLEWNDYRINDETETTPAFRYKGQLYSLDEFMRSDSEYDGIMTLTNTSSIGINLNDSCDAVKVTLIY